MNAWMNFNWLPELKDIFKAIYFIPTANHICKKGELQTLKGWDFQKTTTYQFIQQVFIESLQYGDTILVA